MKKLLFVLMSVCMTANAQHLPLHWQRVDRYEYNLVCDAGKHESQIIAYVIRNGSSHNWETGSLINDLDEIGSYEKLEYAQRAVVHDARRICTKQP